MALGFTKDELEQLSLTQLVKLAGYYKIEIPGRKPTKAAYVNTIWDTMRALEPDPNFIPNAEGTNVPRYSVRLQRIMDNIKKGNQ